MQTSCAAFDGCNFYTFDPTGKGCIFFADCATQNDDFCPDCVTGQPGCNDDGGGDGDGAIIMVESYRLKHIYNFFFHFVAHWVMVVSDSDCSATIEMVSLDPVNYPVPDCLRSLNDFPESIKWMAGGVINGLYI